MKFTILAAVVLCTTSAVADAALVVSDWQAAGDGAITFDTATGLQWLDLDASFNRSVTDVTAQLGAGGDFEGFRYASEMEVRTLFVDAGIPDLSGSWNSLNYLPVQNLQTLIGVTRASFGESFGATSDQGISPSYVLGIGLQQQSNPASSVYQQARVLTNSSIMLDQTSFLAHWLVRPVPLPSALWLFSSGLAGLFWITWHRKRYNSNGGSRAFTV